jgi:hypothetical protein
VSRSLRTQQPEAAARRRVPRDEAGEIVLPRIVVRRPRRGEIHPLPARALRKILRREVPIEYLNGLERIELRPRIANEVGDPFGMYLRAEKTIVLYSLPLEWTWERGVPRSLIAGMRRFYAQVEETPSEVHVRWPAAEVLLMWFFIEVFAHELGHHYRYQYRIRRGSGAARRHEEFIADTHTARFYGAMIERLRSGGRRS